MPGCQGEIKEFLRTVPGAKRFLWEGFFTGIRSLPKRLDNLPAVQPVSPLFQTCIRISQGIIISDSSLRLTPPIPSET
jgi:hypothetical protein